MTTVRAVSLARYYISVRTPALALGVLLGVCAGYLPLGDLYADTDTNPVVAETDGQTVDEANASSTVFETEANPPATTTESQPPSQPVLQATGTAATNTKEIHPLSAPAPDQPATQTTTQDCGEIYSWYIDPQTEARVEAYLPINDCDDPFQVETGKLNYSYQLGIDGTEINGGESLVLDGTKPRTQIELLIQKKTFLVNGNWSLRLYLQTDDGFEQVFHQYVVNGSVYEWHIPQLPAGEYEVVMQFNPAQYIQTLTPHDDMQISTRSLSITYDPIKPVEKTGASSVLFLPGIQSTRLHQEQLLFDEELWPPSINGKDVTELQMTEWGESVNRVYVKPEEVIDRVSYPATEDIVVYDGFLEYLDQAEAAGDISSWYAFAYDWRYDVESVVRDGARLIYADRLFLVDQLKAEADAAENGRVTIIAHSNGGLLTKALMLELEERCFNGEYQWCPETLVDRIVFVGSPQIGTPKAIQSLLHGDTVQGLQNIVFNQAEFRRTALNFPAAYDLLPSFEYFNVWQGEPIITFSDETPLGELFSNEYPNGIVDASDFQDFLFGDEGRTEPAEGEVNVPLRVNGKLMIGTDQRALNQLFWRAPVGVEVYEIVGVGQVTQRGLSYEPFPVETCTLKYFFCESETILKPVPKTSLYGDQTVMAISAAAYKGPKQTLYFDMEEYNEFAGQSSEDDLLSVAHANLIEPKVVQSLLTNMLVSSDSSDLPPFITEEMPDFGDVSLIEHSVHSPATLLIENSTGQRSGLEVSGSDGLIHEEIPNSSVLFLGNSIYVYVPPGGDYHITVSAYAAGVVSLQLREVKGTGETDLLESLRGIPIATSSVLTYTSTTEGVSDVVHRLSPTASTAVQLTWTGEATEVASPAEEETVVDEPTGEPVTDDEVTEPVLVPADQQRTSQATRVADRAATAPSPRVLGVATSQLTPDWQEVYRALVQLQQVLDELEGQL